MKRVTLVSNGKTFPLELAEDDNGLNVRLSGDAVEIGVGQQKAGGLSLLVGDRSYEAQVVIRDKEIAVDLDGERFLFEIDDGNPSGTTGQQDHGGFLEVKAPMPGKVVKLLVAAGDTVEAGQGILLFEAMKMQNEIRSPMKGAVVDLAVAEGQAVESREKLFAIRSV